MPLSPCEGWCEEALEIGLYEQAASLELSFSPPRIVCLQRICYLCVR